MAKGKNKSEQGAGDKAPVDPNLPRPDGPNVSKHGGLVFVGVILGLVGVAIVAQFLTAQ